MRDSNVIYQAILIAEKGQVDRCIIERLYKEYEKALNQEYIKRMRGL